MLDLDLSDAEYFGGVTASTAESPSDRDPRSVTLSLIGNSGEAQIVAWSDGQAQFLVYDAAASDFAVDRYIEHFDTSSLHDLLNEARRLIT